MATFARSVGTARSVKAAPKVLDRDRRVALAVPGARRLRAGHRATGKSGAGRRGALVLGCLSLLVFAGLFGAGSASAAFTHPFLSEFTGSDTPAGSLGTADKVGVRQSNGNVYVIDKGHGVVDTFDSSGHYLSQVGPFGSFGGDPDIAVDNSSTASEGNLYVLPEFGPLSAYNASGTLLYQLNGSNTPAGSWGDVCGLAVDSSADLYVADYSNQAIYKFNSSGNYLTTFNVSFRPCDVAVDTDGTIYAIAWQQALHKLDSTGAELGIIDSQSPKAVNVDPSSHHVYVVHDSSVSEYDSSGNLVDEFGAGRLQGSRGVDINGASGNVYVSSNPAAGGRVEIFGPATVVPDVTTGTATVSGTSATLNGHVGLAGAGDITDCHFDYGTDTSYGNSVPCAQATPITGPTDVSAQISGLEPCTVYHFRLDAANANGANTGNDQTFLSSFAPGSRVGCFGGPGSGPGQLQSPLGVAVAPSSGDVYVADSGNARVEQFDSTGHFIAAFGWGVSDGKAQSEVCTSNCQAGIPGSGAGQFSNPTSVAAANGRLFVGDSGNNVVDKFDADGGFISAIDGSSTPQGKFQSLAGVAIDQSGNLWTADGATHNIDEFGPSGAFVRQWTDTAGSPSAIAVDSTRGRVYLITSGETDSWTLTGQNRTSVDPGGGRALALDPRAGNLYVDHGGDVAVYDPTAIHVASFSLQGTTNSAGTNSGGLAFAALTGGLLKPGQGALYVSDASNDNVTILGPPTTPGRPLITQESETQTAKTTATLTAGIVPLGLATTCTFQFVSDASFQASGYTNATSVPCTPASLGSGFTYQGASANLTGLTPNTTYHFHVVATNSAGTTTGTDQTFTQIFDWAPFDRCPVDDPAMLATTGAGSLGGGSGTVPICLASNSTHGSITIGNISTPTGNTNLQAGLVLDNSTATFTVIPPAAGALVADPVQLSTAVGPVTAITESAGAPSNFNLIAGISLGQPIITLPIKIQLANNSTLGPNCFIGSNQNPIVLQPENTDLSNASAKFESFDVSGAPDPNGPLAGIFVMGAVQGDDTFAVPGATGCGTNDSLDAAVNAVAGLPSPSGSNHLVLDDASSALLIPISVSTGVGLTGQQFASDWHIAFG